MLEKVQRGLEKLYRITTNVCVKDYVIDASVRAHFRTERRPREQLLVTEEQGELEIGLFVDEQALGNLARNDPNDSLADHNLQDFLLVVEGVSHFLYVVWCAESDREVSVLELELQAEMDKYISCLLTCSPSMTNHLHRRLFVDFSWEEDLTEEERERYCVANANAKRYSASLERRFLAKGRMGDMLSELRRFYRMSLASKIDFIHSAA